MIFLDIDVYLMPISISWDGSRRCRFVASDVVCLAALQPVFLRGCPTGRAALKSVLPTYKFVPVNDIVVQCYTSVYNIYYYYCYYYYIYIYIYICNILYII